jgi:DNA-binding NarL/FixJ family response regulator
MATPTVLLCDPHSVVRLGTRAALNGIAKIVHECDDGIEAVRQCLKLKPNIAILGVGLPWLNGTLAAHQILKARGFAPRVILLTADERPETIERAYAVRVHGYLCKSSDIELIKDAVKAVISGQEWFDDKVKKVLGLHAHVPGFPKRPDKLSAREYEIFCSVGNGYQNKEIADKLGISEKTVKVHRDNIGPKTGCHTTREIIKFCHEAGLVMQRAA